MEPRLHLCVVGDPRTPHVVERARAFAERGHRVELISELVVAVPGVALRVPEQYTSLPKLRVLGRARAILAAIDACAADVLHVHFAHGFPAWVAPAARTRPLVVSVMGGDVLFDERGRTPRDRRLTIALLQAADLVTAKSHFLADAVRAVAPGVRCERVLWGVDTRRFSPRDAVDARRRLRQPLTGFIVLSPRGLQPLYNIEAVVAGFAAGLGGDREARLLVMEHAPDPAYAQRVRALVASLGLGDRVSFLPGVTSREMSDLYAAADVVVSAPLSDGLPQTLLEAMACGRPHVLPPLPRYRELVEHERDALFAEATPAGLGAALARLRADPSLRRQLGDQARLTIVREADRDRELDAMEALYREVMMAKRGARWLHRASYLGRMLATHLGGHS